MLKLSQNPESETLNEKILVECFRRLNPQDKIVLLQSYLCQVVNVPEENVNLKIDMFPKTSRHIITMVTAILGIMMIKM
jgi:hypothetical protein